MSGNSSEHHHKPSAPGAAIVPPGTGTAPAWITPELLAQTRDVWSPYYGRDVSAAEATEILLNVKRLASLLVGQPKASRASGDAAGISQIHASGRPAA